MNSIKKTARIAGLMNLLLIVFGLLSLIAMLFGILWLGLGLLAIGIVGLLVRWLHSNN